MKIQAFVQGVLAYDNELPEEKGYGLHSLVISESVNKGGTATIVMPRTHPMRGSFTPFQVPVEVYRDGKLRWRGRPIPPVKDDFYGNRTILCEGELCFLQDAIHRPYAYSDTAAKVFAAVIGVYNAAVEPWKRFAVGDVTVAGSVDLTAKNPENVLATVQKLLSSCGGYIFFDTAADGSRRINWYADFPYTCTQTIRYGYNLTDYSYQTDGTGFATRIIPYGATGEDGNRITINNNGKDYVENEAAVALYGVVEKSVTYNDISDPAELLTRAKQDVEVSGSVPAVITLGALDMSRQDLALESFAVGQKVPAESEAHSLAGAYYLTSLTEDLVAPQAGGVTLTRDLADAGVAQKTLSDSVASKDAAAVIAGNAIAKQTQLEIFNKLTNYGRAQGLFMDGDQLYINASYLAAGVIASSDGSVRIDLLNNKVSVDTSQNGYIGRIDISSKGIEGYGYDAVAKELVKTLSIWPGGKSASGNNQLTSINSGASEGGISIFTIKAGAPLALGLSSNPIEIIGSPISIGGKTVGWTDNGDGTYTLVGT